MATQTSPAYSASGAVLAVLLFWASGAAAFPPEARTSWVAILCALLLLAGEGLRRRFPWLAAPLWCGAATGLIAGSAAALYPAVLIPWWMGIGVAFLAAVFAVMKLDLRSGLSVVLLGVAGALIVAGVPAPGTLLLLTVLLWACLWDRPSIAWIVMVLIVSSSWLRATSGEL